MHRSCPRGTARVCPHNPRVCHGRAALASNPVSPRVTLGVLPASPRLLDAIGADPGAQQPLCTPQSHRRPSGSAHVHRVEHVWPRQTWAPHVDPQVRWPWVAWQRVQGTAGAAWGQALPARAPPASRRAGHRAHPGVCSSPAVLGGGGWSQGFPGTWPSSGPYSALPSCIRAPHTHQTSCSPPSGVPLPVWCSQTVLGPPTPPHMHRTHPCRNSHAGTCTPIPA